MCCLRNSTTRCEIGQFSEQWSPLLLTQSIARHCTGSLAPTDHRYDAWTTAYDESNDKKCDF